jgi:hypothetical protein
MHEDLTHQAGDFYGTAFHSEMFDEPGAESLPSIHKNGSMGMDETI